jgi:hypothetical protein
MRRALSIMIISLLPMFIYAGNDTIYYNAKWNEIKAKGEAEYYRIFYLLKNGKFKCEDHYHNNSIQMIGYYNDRQLTIKDSIFEYYTKEGLISEVKKYRKGKIVLFYKTIIQNHSIVDTIYYRIDTMPKLLNGKSFSAIPKHGEKLPHITKDIWINETIKLFVIIEKTGQVSSYQVEKKTKLGSDVKSIEVIQGRPEWQPGIYNGQKVKCKVLLPIMYDN